MNNNISKKYIALRDHARTFATEIKFVGKFRNFDEGELEAFNYPVIFVEFERLNAGQFPGRRAENRIDASLQFNLHLFQNNFSNQFDSEETTVNDRAITEYNLLEKIIMGYNHATIDGYECWFNEMRDDTRFTHVSHMVLNFTTKIKIC